jgi:hypothetical protein
MNTSVTDGGNVGLSTNIEEDQSTKRHSSSLVACVCFFLLLCTWTSIPHGATGDMDFHLTNIWCAAGEKGSLCADIDLVNNTAEVPFMFQMCNSRNIDYWPYCEIESENPPTQRLRMASPEHLSFYYRIVHEFVNEQIQTSVLRIRLFNSTISTLVFYFLLTLTTRRIKFAAVTGMTFSIIPFGLQHFSGVTTRGWAILGVMTSWAFLTSYLQTQKSETKLRLLQLLAFLFSSLLALTSRIDSVMMVLITSLVVVISHMFSNTQLNKKRTVLICSGIGFLALLAPNLPIVKQYTNLSIPSGYGTAQYMIFQLVHIPEAVADWWNYQIGQNGSGPGVVGLIGVVLFLVNLAFALQQSDLLQRVVVASFTFIIFVLLMKSSSVAASLVPLTGFYTLGIAVPWIGLAIANSNSKLQFMTTAGNRRTAIALLSFSHAVFFYNLLEFYARRGKNLGYFETISLNDEWWWNIGVGPNVVFISGAILFPVFLTTMWRTIALEFPEKQTTLILQNKSC